MSIRSLALLSLVVAATPAFCQTPEPTDVSGNIHWVYNYEDGQAVSEKTNKPMFIVFRCER